MAVTLRQEAYEYVRDKLVCGDLKSGARLSILGLARELDISNMPVREALNQLDAEGLVESVHRGYVVRNLDEEEMAELFDFRLLLETHAAVQCARHISRRDLGELEDVCLAMRAVGIEARQTGGAEPTDWHPRLSKCDLRFHQILIRAGGNRWVARAAENVNLIGRMFHYKQRLPEGATVVWHAARYYRVHMKIVRAIRERRVEEMPSIIRAHLLYGDPRCVRPRLKFPGEASA